MHTDKGVDLKNQLKYQLRLKECICIHSSNLYVTKTLYLDSYHSV